MGRIFFAFILFLILAGQTCLAEKLDFEDSDFRFVDSRENMGYYVDMKSVTIAGAEDAKARVKMVRIDANRLYIYTIKFNRVKKLYQIIDSVVAVYDTKEKTGGTNNPMKPMRYGKGSPMESVADFIYHPTP